MSTIEIVTYAFHDADFPVAVMPIPGGAPYPLHTHPFTELVVILGGQATHVLGETTSCIQTGDIFVVATGNVHAYQDTHNLHLVNVLFMPEVLQQYEADFRALPGYHALFVLEPHFRHQYGGRSQLHLAPEAMSFVIDCLERMAHEDRTGGAGARLMITTTLAQLILYLSRQYAHVESTPSRVFVQVGEVLSRMERDYMHPLPLQELADAGAMSVRTLVRRFREGTGLSPVEYLIRLRIRQGATLLRATALSITDVAAAVGMPDSNYFSRQFKRLTGATPRAYRRQRPEQVPQTTSTRELFDETMA